MDVQHVSVTQGHPEPVETAIKEGDLIAAGVLSGNRNFEGRIHPWVKANFLASPPLVVAYALAGTVDIDLSTEPLGKGNDGNDVYLKDIWPTTEEIVAELDNAIRPDLFNECIAMFLTPQLGKKFLLKAATYLLGMMRQPTFKNRLSS